MEWLKIILDFLVNMAWPILGLVTLLLLKNELSSAISSLSSFVGRVTTIGPNGIQTTVPNGIQAISNEQKTQLESSSSNVANTSPPLILKSYKTVLDRENKINAELNGQYSNVSESDKKEALINHLAAYQFESWVKTIYYEIFDSQILLLESLVKENDGIPYTKVEEFFKSLQNKHVLLKDFTLDSYTRFLENYKLIQRNLENFQITDDGKDFIKFINDYNWSKNRNGL